MQVPFNSYNDIQNHPAINKVSWIGFILIFIVYISYFFVFAVEFPYYDDYFLLFEALVRINHSDNAYELLKALFAQHNDHRIFTHRILLFLFTKTFGSVSVELMLFIGNLTTLIISLVVVRLCQLTGKIVLLIPIALILFQPQQYINMFGTYGIYNNGVIMYAFLSVYFLSIPVFNRKADFAIALFFAFCATFSNGNGFTVWATGAGLLLLNRRYQSLALWIAMTIAVLVLFFKWNYEIPVSIKKETSLRTIAFQAAYFFRLLGNSDMVNPRYNVLYLTLFFSTLCFEAGAIYLLLKRLVLIRFQNIPGTYNLLLGMLMFLLGTCTILAMFRAGNTPEDMPADYYRIYSLLVFLLCVLIYSWEIKKSYFNAVTGIVTIAGLAFWAASYVKYTPEIIVNYKNNLLADRLNFHSTRKIMLYPVISGYTGKGSSPDALECLDMIEKEGEYVVKGRGSYHEIRNAIAKKSDTNTDDVLAVSISKDGDYITIANTKLRDPGTAYGNHPMVVLRNEGKLYFFPSKRSPRFFLLKPYLPGFETRIHKEILRNLIPNGDYEVFVVTSDVFGHPETVSKSGIMLHNDTFVQPKAWKNYKLQKGYSE
jgi:hypothetical protein